MKAAKVTRGVCRVCGCSDDVACPTGCYWSDAAQTICSACAEPLFRELLAERSRQIAKWGNTFPAGGFDTMVAVLTEEVGEVARAVLDGDRKNLRVELVQVAAACLRMIEQVDRGDPLRSSNKLQKASKRHG
ncbi:MAG: hypothetical protein DI536_04335 [Archangium gephyra]|uniref:NTP pyrophosphohydrolase MazG-like domain-containing protein n=1 Tax=Archangium gephyra TaxID=48 RepID=A0A2W5V7X8_9BACT|nr:MAG: hypothetical protein DI536_04335 [Archangium gephyra]